MEEPIVNEEERPRPKTIDALLCDLAMLHGLPLYFLVRVDSDMSVKVLATSSIKSDMTFLLDKTMESIPPDYFG